MQNILLVLLILSLYHCNQVKQQNSSYFENIHKDSTSFEYDKSGNLIVSTDYKDGVKNGIEKIFYENGKIKHIKSYWNGIMFGNQLLYNQDEQITKVLFFNFDQKKIFDISFNVKGEVTSKRGVPFYIVANSYKLRENDTLKLLIYTPHLPNFEQRVSLKETRSGINKIMDISDAKINFYANTYYLERIFKYSGRYNFILNIELKSQRINETISDTTNIEIEVF